MICHTLLTILRSTPYQTRQASRLCHNQIWLFIVVFLINERLIVCPSMQDQALLCIHRDVSTHVLLVFVRQRGRKITDVSLFIAFQFLAIGVFWRAWCVLARLMRFGALGVFWRAWCVLARCHLCISCPFPALKLSYPSGPLLSQALTPVSVRMPPQCGFGVHFVLRFCPLVMFYCYHPVCCMCFSLFCGWNLQLGPKTCNTIFIFSHQESYVCELNLTMTVNYGFFTFCF